MRATLLIVFTLFSVFGYAVDPSSVRDTVRQTHSLSMLAKMTDDTLERVVANTVQTLRDNGHPGEAKTIEDSYSPLKGEIQRQYSSGYKIGDFTPLSYNLALYYELAAAALQCGVPGKIDICQIAHISDLWTLNFAIPVVFQPCRGPWNENDYRDHFSGDASFYGLFPVLSFWGCVGGTFSIGWTLVCTPAEWLTNIAIAPELSDFIYELFCKA